MTQTTLKPRANSKAAAAKKAARPDPENDFDSGSDFGDNGRDDALSTTPPNVTKKGKAVKGGSKKASAKPLADMENDTVLPGSTNDSSEKYQKVSVLHSCILTRHAPRRLTIAIAYPIRTHSQTARHVRWLD